ncbi:unnamed protein product [Ilex paraguariensis]|uniref:Uncharacterized protein n=1 Tax=Ilex paraguariensis TaxID=185542 RepID=A0ABC8QM42_9AQUA
MGEEIFGDGEVEAKKDKGSMILSGTRIGKSTAALVLEAIDDNVLSIRQLAQHARQERERCQLKELTVHVLEQIGPIDFPESSSVNTMLRGMPPQNLEEGVTAHSEPHSRCSIEIFELAIEQTMATNDVGLSFVITTT